MNTINWLHLSDWHQKGEDFGRTVVLDRLIDDIRQRANIDRSLANLDFVIFSGDLAFAGQPTEFAAARKLLLDPVLEALGLKPERLFIVPGNHDLDRQIAWDMAPPPLQQPLPGEAAVHQWLTDDRRRDRAMEPLRAFHDFVAGYTGQPDPTFASLREWELAGRRVALLGLNSAWMCARRKAEGKNEEVNDYGVLVVGEPQIHGSLQRISEHDLRIAVIHHPFAWLADFDRARVQERLQRAVDVILCGHQHEPNVAVALGPGGDFILIPAGAAYDRRTAENPRYTNAYNFVSMDFARGRGTVYLRKWNDRGAVWAADHDTHQGGYFGFQLPTRLRRRRAPRRSGRGSTGPGTTSTERREAAAAKYRTLLLETCDLLDLANLPASDVHVVQRELQLRRLYMPARVLVVPDSKESDAEFKELEQLRADAKRGVARDGRSPQEGSRRERVPIGTCLSRSVRVVLLGDPGSGKTTFTRWIATAYLLRLKHDPSWKDLPEVGSLPDTDLLPILIRCRDLRPADMAGDLNTLLGRSFRSNELDPTESADLVPYLRGVVDAGTALLVLDGLDEINDPRERAKFCERVDQLAQAKPQLRIVATSRIVGYRDMGRRLARGFLHATLADLAGSEKDAFARQWCALTERPERRDAAARELIAEIHSSDRIERLTGSPILLTTMALVKRKVGKLPQRRADLYEEAIDVLLNMRPEVDRPIEWREAVPQLAYLAYAMCDRGVQQLDETEIVRLLEDMRSEHPAAHDVRARSPEDFLRVVEARTGLLYQAGRRRISGRQTPVYEFRHLTFQEYLAARALADGKYPGYTAERRLADQIGPLAGRVERVQTTGLLKDEDVVVVESWREALRLCIAICRDIDVDPTLHAILGTGDGPGLKRARAQQAALCLADEPNASEAVGAEIATAFAASVRAEEMNLWVTSSLVLAVYELATTRWRTTFARALLAALAHQSGDERRALWRLTKDLAWKASPAGQMVREPKLSLETIESGSEIEAMLALSMLDTSSKEPALSQVSEALLNRLAGSNAMQFVAGARISDLLRAGWRPMSTTVARLGDFLLCEQSDEDAVVEILEALHPAELKEWLLMLEQLLPDHRPRRVRQAAAGALGKLDDTRAVEPLLARLAADQDIDVRRVAARALGKLGDARAVEPLLARFTADDDINVRQAAAEALGKLGDARAVEPLLARLAADQDVSVRRVTAEALGELGDARAVEPLLARLAADDDINVRQAAARALGELGDPRGGEPLLACLTADQDIDVRQAAAEALGELGDARAVEPLLARLAADQDIDVRRVAARALGKLLDPRAVEPLLARLAADQDWRMRQAAAGALGKLGDARAVEPLLARLAADDDIDVRRVAAEALGKLGDARAVEPLLAGLAADQDVSVCQAATEALGELGDPRAVKPLLARLAVDQNVNVRQAAAEALGKLGDARAVEPLLAGLAADQDVSVRQAAAEALGELGDARAVEPLLARLAADEHWRVRYAAARALGKLLDPRVVEPLLARLTPGEDWRVRYAAAEALGELGDARAVEPLIARLATDEGTWVRQAAAGALGKLGDPRAVEPLLARLTPGEHWRVRHAAAEALGKLGDPRVVELLLACLTPGEDWRVRHGATGALGELGDPRAVEPLLARLAAGEDWTVRHGAAGALGKLGDVRAVEPLLARLAADEDIDVRRVAAGALGELGDARAVEPLLAHLAPGEGTWVRQAAAGALGKLGDPRAVEPLLARLAPGEDWRVRRAAAGALGKLGDPHAMRSFREALKHHDAGGAPHCNQWAYSDLGGD
ncbi:HEAT repeat domain-containing protein [Siccirubricoccus sp. G192]|uniref:HEAT repeat domain-containing protein n=1 Tax=Siccirubricoccus sp. G192 TaxID=2849651 RepID=UPI001C2C2470|nr:HEAT repeat domain-containing protein [Siccirubricoccus sp. G192]MBV1800662.1 HEAT repeat domain-containing protein [Siccirubricoccus sp. G192]